MNKEIEYFELSLPEESRHETGFIRFVRSEFSGMVGETIEDYSATMFMNVFNLKGKLVWGEPKDLNYIDLRNLYKKIKGKGNRMRYWYWIRQFSPEAREAQAESEMADAIRRVI